MAQPALKTDNPGRPMLMPTSKENETFAGLTYHLDGINTRWQLWPLAKVRAVSSAGDTVALACFVILQ